MTAAPAATCPCTGFRSILSGLRGWAAIWCAVWLAGLAHAEFTPQIFKAGDVPPQSGMLGGPSFRSPQGDWVVTALNGVIWQDGPEWKMVHLPASHQALWAAPHPAGLIAVAHQGAWRHDGDTWHRLPIDDELGYGLVADGTAFVPGRLGIYAVDPQGGVRLVFRGTTKGDIPLLRRIGKNIMQARPTSNEVLVWDGQMFVSRALPTDWPAAASNAIWVRTDATGDGFFLTDRGPAPAEFLADTSATATATSSRVWPAGTPIPATRNAILIEGHLVTLDRTGLQIYDTATGVRVWRLPAESLPDTILTMRPAPGGALLQGTRGLYMLAHPDHCLSAPLPRGPMIGPIDSPQGILLITMNGQYRPDGTDAGLGLGPVLGLLFLPNGERLVARNGSITWGDTTFPVPEITAPTYFTAITPDLVAVQNREVELLLHRDGTVRKLERRAQATALTVSRDGNPIITTLQGARRFNRDGQLVASWGQGRSMGFRLGDRELVLDSAGDVFDDQGRKVGQLPFLAIHASTTWGDLHCLLVRLPDYTDRVVVINPADFSWRALDLPLASAPRILFTAEGKLHILTDSDILRVSRPVFVPPPSTDLVVRIGDGLRVNDGQLPRETTSVRLDLPAARPRPWTSPTYRLKVGDDHWITVEAGRRINLPRLRWGSTQILAEASHASLVATRSVTLRRPRPWWVDWPGLALYLAAAAGLVTGLVRWRTAQLHRRNAALESIVASRTDELRRANAVKTEFIASMNHELRNPINGIVGLTRMLVQRAGSPRDRLLAESLESCTEQLRATLDDVLDFSAIERGQISLTAEPFELARLARAAVEQGRFNSADAVIELTQPAPDDLWLEGDHGKIRLVLTNFISNAIKYGTAPHATLACEITPAGEDQSLVTLRVSNPGPALSPEEMSTLFQPFVRGRRAAETRARGVGLGLAMCRRYAEAMHGTTTVSCAAGWVHFELRVPLRHVPAPATSPAPALDAPPRAHLLVIEDESYNRLVLAHHLTEMNFAADWASDAAEAVSLARVNRYAAILTDCSLPDAQGTGIITQLRTVTGDSLPPIIVISAYATTAMREAMLQAGARCFLGKPLKPDRLRAALDRYATAASSATTDSAVVVPDPETAAPSGEHINFERLLRTGGPALLQRFADDLHAAVLTLAQPHPDHAAKAAEVHKLRSALTLVDATNANAALSRLEQLLENHASTDEIDRATDDARTEVARAAAAAQAATGRAPAPPPTST